MTQWIMSILECEETLVIRQCDSDDFDDIHAIINDAAIAYKGAIPADCWHEPYMSRDYLKHELDAGVVFWAQVENGSVNGVMGIQPVRDVTLIRHAYVRTAQRSRGIGGRLLAHLKTLTQGPALVGTWKAATWAIRFYEKNGFRLVGMDEKDRLLRKYWSISDRQTETSLVLADERWFEHKLKSI